MCLKVSLLIFADKLELVLQSFIICCCMWDFGAITLVRMYFVYYFASWYSLLISVLPIFFYTTSMFRELNDNLLNGLIPIDLRMLGGIFWLVNIICPVFITWTFGSQNDHWNLMWVSWPNSSILNYWCTCCCCADEEYYLSYSKIFEAPSKVEVSLLFEIF
jgi:hypothetical protein